MKRLLAIVAMTAAFAVPAAAAIPTVTIAMHDPGCHWFYNHGHFTKTMQVRGPVTLRNYDEATLDVRSSTLAGPFGLRTVGVGKTITLGKGTYHITMIGQAPDDNHLTLTIR